MVSLQQIPASGDAEAGRDTRDVCRGRGAVGAGELRHRPLSASPDADDVPKVTASDIDLAGCYAESRPAAGDPVPPAPSGPAGVRLGLDRPASPIPALSKDLAGSPRLTGAAYSGTRRWRRARNGIQDTVNRRRQRRPGSCTRGPGEPQRHRNDSSRNPSAPGHPRGVSHAYSAGPGIKWRRSARIRSFTHCISRLNRARAPIHGGPPRPVRPGSSCHEIHALCSEPPQKVRCVGKVQPAPRLARGSGARCGGRLRRRHRSCMIAFVISTAMERAIASTTQPLGRNSGMLACCQARCARPAGRPWGDSRAGHPLGGARSGAGTDGVGMVTVMCRCRAR